MIHLVLNHEAEVARFKREGVGPLFAEVSQLFPANEIHAMTADWVYDEYRVATFRGKEDVIVGWEGVHARNS